MTAAEAQSHNIIDEPYRDESYRDESYRIVITLALPAAGLAASVPLVLSPADEIELEDGRARRLRDCTLADLREIARGLTEDVWAAYQDIRLPDLAGNDALRVELRRAADDVPLPPEALDHRVMPSALTDLADAATAALETLAPTPDDLAVASTTSPPDEGRPGGRLDDPTTPPPDDPTTNDLPVALATRPPDDPTIDVGVSEPLVPEREAPAGVPQIPEGPLRILGRRRPLGHPTPAAVDILMNEPAFRDAQAHALSSLDKEVAGVLVGPPPEKQPDGRYLVHVSDIIIALHTRMSGASVTYTPESWRYVNDTLAERYPEGDAVIVGWYHTHPGFGIFLSGMDQFIHQHFFTQIWHIALVLDPRARRSGFFCWNRAKTEVDQVDFLWPPWARRSW